MTQNLFGDYPDQTAIDQQYDPDAVAVNGLQSIKHIVALGEQARAQLKCHLRVPFGPTLEEHLDVFPADKPGAPVLVFFHGGYWRANHAATFDGIALGPVAAGFTTVIVNYALCPFVTLDEIVRQTRASLVWVRANIAQYNGDPARVVVSGHSAGGHLTAMSLLTPWQRDYGIDDDWLAGGLMISGLYELSPLRYSYLQPLIQLTGELIEKCSPARQVQKRAVPACITYGSLEQAAFAKQASLMHEHWTAAGNQAVVDVHADKDHYTILQGFETADGALTRAALDLLDRKKRG